MIGEGKIILTGQLGDVMKESAQIGINWIRAHATEVANLDENLDKDKILKYICVREKQVWPTPEIVSIFVQPSFGRA